MDKKLAEFFVNLAIGVALFAALSFAVWQIATALSNKSQEVNDRELRAAQECIDSGGHWIAKPSEANKSMCIYRREPQR